MNRFFVSIGSNLEPEKNVPACLDLLKKGFNLTKVSPIYETDPVGPAGERKFWNLAVEIETDLERAPFTAKLREVEGRLGRKRGADRFAARTLDLDLLPTPDYTQQGFVMVPLADIVPEQRDPESGRSFRELAEPFRAKGGLRKI